MQQFCHARGLPHDGMRVEVEQLAATNPHRIGRFHLRVVLPQGLPPEYATMIERVARSCPAHNTLVRGADVTASIEIPEVLARDTSRRVRPMPDTHAASDS